MAESKFTRDTNIVHRFSDIDGEPCTMLPPIRGFVNSPLVSLEEAVEPLIPIVNDIKRRASLALESCKDKSDDLSSDESGSICLYTMEWEPYTSSLYYILNSTLRNSDREKLKPWFLYLKLILTGLSRLPSIRVNIYRCLKLNEKIEYEKYSEGKEIIWWGFSSCTMNKKISSKEHFINSIGTRILFLIECLNGKDISEYSSNKNAQEVLLLPGTQFQVIRYDHQRDDIHKIYMKEIQPQSILLEPIFSSTTSLPLKKQGAIQKLFEQIFQD
jgi:hypothetical protein